MKAMFVLALRLLVALPFFLLQVVAEESKTPLVRIAELDIDPAQVESYKSALKEEIEASIRLESGVLTLYAVAVKEHPERIRIF